MPVCGNYLFFELPKKIVLNPKDGKETNKNTAKLLQSRFTAQKGAIQH